MSCGYGGWCTELPVAAEIARLAAAHTANRIHPSTVCCPFRVLLLHWMLHREFYGGQQLAHHLTSTQTAAALQLCDQG
jgi:hypothetical protein